jgi:hypothetical protein
MLAKPILSAVSMVISPGNPDIFVSRFKVPLSRQ